MASDTTPVPDVALILILLLQTVTDTVAACAACAVCADTVVLQITVPDIPVPDTVAHPRPPPAGALVYRVCRTGPTRVFHT